jgi:predicted metal-dependent HD superfamily phosphohydrolase
LGRQPFDAKILLEMDIDMLLDAPQHACRKTAALLLLGGYVSRVEYIQTRSRVYLQPLAAAALHDAAIRRCY